MSWQTAFLEALERGRTIKGAALEAGISRTRVYALSRTSPEFHHLLSEARTRARAARERREMDRSSDQLDALEKRSTTHPSPELFRDAMRRTGGNITRSAALLRISRMTLHRRLRNDERFRRIRAELMAGG